MGHVYTHAKTIAYCMEHACKKLFIVYLKSKLSWVSCRYLGPLDTLNYSQNLDLEITIIPSPPTNEGMKARPIGYLAKATQEESGWARTRTRLFTNSPPSTLPNTPRQSQTSPPDGLSNLLGKTLLFWCLLKTNF